MEGFVGTLLKLILEFFLYHISFCAINIMLVAIGMKKKTVIPFKTKRYWKDVLRGPFLWFHVFGSYYEEYEE